MTYSLPPARGRFSLATIFKWIACVGLAALLYWSFEPSSAREVVNWRPDLGSASSEAQQSHKLVFADFTATWCGPCQEMRRELWSDKKVASALEAFVPVQIDVDQNRPVAARYQIEGIPAFFLLDREGRVVKRSEGGMTKSEFLDWIKR